MWTYPIDLVYNFYHTAVANEQRNMAFVSGLARIASYSARDLFKEGAKSIEKLWSDYTKPLVSPKARGAATTQNSTMQTGNKAADGLFGSGKFQAVRLAEPATTTGV